MERISDEEISRRRQEAIANPPPRLKKEEPPEDEYEYVPTHFSRKPEVKLAPGLAAVDSFGINPRNETAAPLCLEAADSKECQLEVTTTNDNRCQEGKLTQARKPVWKKARKDKQKPRPVKKNLPYLHLYTCYHPGLGESSWSEAMI